MSQCAQTLLRGLRGVQTRDVGAVDFVPGEGVEIYAPVADVDGAVGGVGDGVDAEEGAGDFVNDSGEGFDVVDRAQDVACVGAGEEFGLGG